MKIGVLSKRPSRGVGHVALDALDRAPFEHTHQNENASGRPSLTRVHGGGWAEGPSCPTPRWATDGGRHDSMGLWRSSDDSDRMYEKLTPLRAPPRPSLFIRLDGDSGSTPASDALPPAFEPCRLTRIAGTPDRRTPCVCTASPIGRSTIFSQR